MKIFLVLLAILIVFQIIRLVILGRQARNHELYWTRLKAEQVPANAIWYVALGDSAAQGVGASSPGRSYVGLLASALKQKTGRPIHVVNLGISGAKTKDALDIQLPKLNKLALPKDTIVTLEIGANDMAHYEPNSFREQIDQLLSSLPKQTIVADIPYFGGGLFRSREKAVIQANVIITQHIKKYGLKQAQLHDITEQKDSLVVYAADFFHPSNKGYQNWFEAFWQVLDH